MVYAGGLGVLSGDHLKESSDLGIPLVGVGFLYTYDIFLRKLLRMAGKKPAMCRLSTTTCL